MQNIYYPPLNGYGQPYFNGYTTSPGYGYPEPYQIPVTYNYNSPYQYTVMRPVYNPPAHPPAPSIIEQHQVKEITKKDINQAIKSFLTEQYDHKNQRSGIIAAGTVTTITAILAVIVAAIAMPLIAPHLILLASIAIPVGGALLTSAGVALHWLLSGGSKADRIERTLEEAGGQFHEFVLKSPTRKKMIEKNNLEILVDAYESKHQIVELEQKKVKKLNLINKKFNRKIKSAETKFEKIERCIAQAAKKDGRSLSNHRVEDITDDIDNAIYKFKERITTGGIIFGGIAVGGMTISLLTAFIGAMVIAAMNPAIIPLYVIGGIFLGGTAFSFGVGIIPSFAMGGFKAESILKSLNEAGYKFHQFVLESSDRIEVIEKGNLLLLAKSYEAKQEVEDRKKRMTQKLNFVESKYNRKIEAAKQKFEDNENRMAVK